MNIRPIATAFSTQFGGDLTYFQDIGLIAPL